MPLLVANSAAVTHSIDLEPQEIIDAFIDQGRITAHYNGWGKYWNEKKWFGGVGEEFVWYHYLGEPAKRIVHLFGWRGDMRDELPRTSAWLKARLSELKIALQHCLYEYRPSLEKVEETGTIEVACQVLQKQSDDLYRLREFIDREFVDENEPAKDSEGRLLGLIDHVIQVLEFQKKEIDDWVKAPVEP